MYLTCLYLKGLQIVCQVKRAKKAQIIKKLFATDCNFLLDNELIMSYYNDNGGEDGRCGGKATL